MEKKIVESIPDTNTPGTNTTIFDEVDPIVSVPGINVDYAFDEEEDKDEDKCEECGFDSIDHVKEVIQIRNLADSIKKYSVQIKHSIDLESFADDLFDEIISKFVDIHKDHERFNKNELIEVLEEPVCAIIDAFISGEPITVDEDSYRQIALMLRMLAEHCKLAKMDNGDWMMISPVTLDTVKIWVKFRQVLDNLYVFYDIIP